MFGAAERLVDAWLNRGQADESSLAAAHAAIAALSPAVVVTGGSRGIGRAIAARFVTAGRTVVLVARGAGDLGAAQAAIVTAHGGDVRTLVCDITECDAAEQLAGGLAAHGLYCDVLVNNAGLGLAGPFADCDAAKLDRLISLNIGALSRLTRAMLPAMLARRRGGILNVASLGAFVPGPQQAVYYASKAYVVSLTEALRAECAGRGVRISVVAPGPVDTRFHADMGAQDSAYRLLLPGMSAERVAAGAYRGYMLGLRVIVPGVTNTIMFMFLKLLPHRLSVPVVAALLKVPD